MTKTAYVGNASKVADELGWELMEFKRFDNNPLNNYLAWVICKRQEGDYTTHLYNADSEEGLGGFYEGHYGFKTLEDAMKDFVKRS